MSTPYSPESSLDESGYSSINETAYWADQSSNQTLYTTALDVTTGLTPAATKQLNRTFTIETLNMEDTSPGSSSDGSLVTAPEAKRIPSKTSRVSKIPVLVSLKDAKKSMLKNSGEKDVESKDQKCEMSRLPGLIKK